MIRSSRVEAKRICPEGGKGCMNYGGKRDGLGQNQAAINFTGGFVPIP